MNAVILYHYYLSQKLLAAKAFNRSPTVTNRELELAAGAALGAQIKRMQSAGIPIPD